MILSHSSGKAVEDAKTAYMFEGRKFSCKDSFILSVGSFFLIPIGL